MTEDKMGIGGVSCKGAYYISPLFSSCRYAVLLINKIRQVTPLLLSFPPYRILRWYRPKHYQSMRLLHQ